MGEMVQCVKLQKEAEGLDRAPYPGELGQRILENVSKDAWQMWFQQQTMLINEYRLNPVDPKAREFWSSRWSSSSSEMGLQLQSILLHSGDTWQSLLVDYPVQLSKKTNLFTG